MGLPSQIVPMSFALHEKLADKYNGAVEWGYRRVSTVSVEGNLMKTGPAPWVEKWLAEPHTLIGEGPRRGLA